MVYILDTHTLIWFFEGGEKLGSRAVNILRDNTQRLIIPSIVLTEIKYLPSKKKTHLSVEEVIFTLENDPRCTIYPLDTNVVQLMPVVWDIHDGIILGTALVYRDFLGEEVTVITKDMRIKNAGIVNTMW